MVVYCTVCINNTRKNKNISYFNYPKENNRFPADEIRRYQWIVVVRKERNDKSWMPLKNTRICSNHFKSEEKYISVKGRLLLKNNALPFMQLPAHASGPPTITIVKTESIIADPSTSNTQDSDPLHKRIRSPTGLSDIGSSDLEDALDTPMVVYLKSKLKRQETKCKKHIQKLNNLQKVNKRLAEKNKLLKQVLTKFKKRIVMLEGKLSKDDEDGVVI